MVFRVCTSEANRHPGIWLCFANPFGTSGLARTNPSTHRAHSFCFAIRTNEPTGHDKLASFRKTGTRPSSNKPAIAEIATQLLRHPATISSQFHFSYPCILYKAVLSCFLELERESG